MSAPAGSGRVLRAGRTLARVLLTWALATGALIALDAWLSGFAMNSWWQPPVAALLLGVLTAGVWPLVLRVALPLAFLTLGLGGFLGVGEICGLFGLCGFFGLVGGGFVAVGRFLATDIAFRLDAAIR